MKKKIILVILFLIASLIGTGLVYGFNTVSQLNQMVAAPKMDETQLAVNNNLDIDTVNIAVFGLDGRSDVEGDRSDTIMIVSLDFRNGNVRVSSIMRDLLVQIPETANTYESLDKINAAYAYGGPELAVKTLNQNFDLNITDYVVVNFDCMVDTVDALGGVEINVQNEDVLDWTNKYIDDVNDKVGKSDPKLTTTGVQTVTGVQALAYARNRYSDDDFHRTERQREVVKQIAKKAFNIDLVSGVNLLSKIYPYVKTTLTINEITTYAKAFMSSPDKQFLEFRLPTDAYCTTGLINSVSYVIPTNLVDNVIALHAFIYGSAQTATSTGTTASSGSSTTSSGTSSSSTSNGTNSSVSGRTNVESPISSSSGSSSTSSSGSSSSSASSSSSGKTAYVPSARVQEISDAIASFSGMGSTSSYSDSLSSGSSSGSSSYTTSNDSSSSYSNTESSGSSSSGYNSSGSGSSSTNSSGSSSSDSSASGSDSSSSSSGSDSSSSGSGSSSTTN